MNKTIVYTPTPNVCFHCSKLILLSNVDEFHGAVEFNLYEIFMGQGRARRVKQQMVDQCPVLMSCQLRFPIVPYFFIKKI